MSSTALSRTVPKVGERVRATPLPWSQATTWLVLILLGAVPYLNTLVNGFVYDDGYQVLQNAYLHSFRYLKQIFTTVAWSFQGTQGVTNYYRPMMTFFYLNLYQLYGPLPYPYHLVNVVGNVLVVFAVFGVTSRLLRDRRMGMVAAAIFAVHPIHTEVVAWVAAISDIQLALFLLAAFLCFLALPGAEGARWLRLQSGMAAGFVLALLSKEPAAMFPAIITAYEHFYREDRKSTSWRVKLSRYGLLWVLLAAYMAFRIRFLGALVPIFQRAKLGWHDTILTALALFGQHVSKLFWPSHLAAFHPFQPWTQLADPWVLFGLAALIACVVLFLVLWSRARIVSFGFIWFLIFLAPVLNARWLPANVFAERYLYVPSIGFCWIAGWAGVRLWAVCGARPRVARIALAAAAGVILTAATVRTALRNRDWHDDVSLNLSTLRVFPDSATPHADLGSAYWNSGKHALAEQQWEEAIRISPESFLAWDNMGLARIEQKRYDEAIRCVKRAIELRPRFASAHLHLGTAYFKTGHLGLAEAEFLKVVELFPLNPDGRNHLGELYVSENRIREAEEQYLASVNAMPTPDGYHGLGDIYVLQGRLAEAERIFRTNTREYTYDHHAHFRLGRIYASWGRSADAIREYKAGLVTDPNNAEAQAALRRLQSGGSATAPSS